VFMRAAGHVLRYSPTFLAENHPFNEPVSSYATPSAVAIGLASVASPFG